jgi:tetratricopeptide (TPR) repeat protein
MLPAIRGILPRIHCETGAPNETDCKLFTLGKPSGNMPDGASRMLALPDQQRCAPFRLRMLMILLCAFFPLIALAQSESEFTKANQEYAQGHFKEAIAGYEALVHGGQWNANLFYDLGNAYFRTRDFGRAILNYERALALDQHHPEATANLQIARDESRALELQPTRLERYLQFASINQYSIAAAVALWLGIFGIVALIFARRRSAALMSLSILCLLVHCCCLGDLHARQWQQRTRARHRYGQRCPGAPRYSGHSKQRSRLAGWQRNQDSKHARRLDVRRAAE